MAAQLSCSALCKSFAPLKPSSLQSLKSMKNCQNVLRSSPSKRKAAEYEADNLEPIIDSPKRRKALVNKPIFKAPAPLAVGVRKSLEPLKTPLTAPADRSPLRKRAGFLNQGRSGGPFIRIESPTFTGSKSLIVDTALKGSATGYARRTSLRAAPELCRAAPKPTWFFDICPDTVEDLLANTSLTRPSTSILDISYEEAEDNRGKENVPPIDDLGRRGYRTPRQPQQGSKRIDRKVMEEDACDVDRSPLSELPVEDFYDERLDANSAFAIFDNFYEEAS